jgi:hypothetical protein
MAETRALTLRLDAETSRRLEERARSEERDVAQQARFLIKRALADKPTEATAQ